VQQYAAPVLLTQRLAAVAVDGELIGAMADAPGVQLPFCRNEEQPPQADAAADAIIGRLVAKIAQLEEQLYARDWQGTSDHGTCWWHARKPRLCCCATTAPSVVVSGK
jgi:hypothetical protein